MLISSAVLWIGCLFVYISSPNQKILKKPLPKKITYPIFIIGVVMSVFLLLPEYSLIISSLVVLIQIMVMWTSTVFILGHIKPGFISYLIGGALFFSLLSLLGGIS